MPYGPASALYIPAGVWHAVVNTGDEPVSMVFAFPHPDYPPTERRSSRAVDADVTDELRRARRRRLPGHRARGLRRPDARPRQRPRARRRATVWIKRKGLALDEVEPDDVIALDLDDPDALEARPTTTSSRSCTPRSTAPDRTSNAVIHGHPLYGTALGATDGALRVPDPRRGPVRRTGSGRSTRARRS